MTCKASQGPALPFIWANPDLPEVREDNGPEVWKAWDFWSAYHAGEVPLIASSYVRSTPVPSERAIAA